METEIKHQPNYYAIIPADVRYSNAPAAAKLLFGEITALTSKEGYCWATNEYFAGLYQVSNRNVQRWLTSLEELGFIRIENRSSKLREIFLTLNMDKNVRVPAYLTRTKMSDKPGQKSTNNEITPIYNNTSNNTHIEFGKFWELYPKKVEKKKAEAKWNRLKKTEQDAILTDLPKRKATEQWQKAAGQYVPNPTTYLNGERWNDSIVTPASIVNYMEQREAQNLKIKEMEKQRSPMNSAGRKRFEAMGAKFKIGKPI